MFPEMSRQVETWEDSWKSRIDFKDRGHWKIQINTVKQDKIAEALCQRFYYVHRNKLDIGCGPAFYLHVIRKVFPDWHKYWTGIDLSPTAVAFCKEFGLNASVDNIYAYKTDQKFNAFFLLDAFEHLEDHESLAKKIQELSFQGECSVFINMPLYHIAREGVIERPVDINTCGKFANYFSLFHVWNQVYGCHGFPYMMYEFAYVKK